MATAVSLSATLSSRPSTVDALPNASPASFFDCDNASNYIKIRARPVIWLLFKIICSLNIFLVLLQRRG